MKNGKMKQKSKIEKRTQMKERCRKGRDKSIRNSARRGKIELNHECKLVNSVISIHSASFQFENQELNYFRSSN